MQPHDPLISRNKLGAVIGVFENLWPQEETISRSVALVALKSNWNDGGCGDSKLMYLQPVANFYEQ